MCALLFLDRSYLSQPASVPASFEVGPKESINDGQRERVGSDAASQCENVGVIVLSRQLRVEFGGAERGPHPVHLVRGDLLSLAAPSQDDAQVGNALHDRPADAGAEGRVINLALRIRPQVDDLVTGRAQVPGNDCLQGETGVIRAEGYPHAVILSRLSATNGDTIEGRL